MEMRFVRLDEGNSRAEKTETDAHMNRPGPQFSVSEYRGRRFYKVATLCLGMLCFLLLIIIITLCVYYNGINAEIKRNENRWMQACSHIMSNYTEIDQLKMRSIICAAEKLQLQTSYNACVTQKDQLQTSCNSCTAKTEQLQANYITCTAQKNQLQTSYSACTTQKDHLQTNSSICTAQKDHLQTNYNTCNTQKDQLQTSYNTCNAKKDQLQTSYSTCAALNDYMQSSYNNCTAQKDQFQTYSSTCNVQKDQLQTRYSMCTAQKDQLQTDSSTCTVQKNELQTSYSTCTTQKDQLQTSYSTCTAEKDHLQVNYSTSTAQKDQLQANYSTCTVQKDQLKTNYSTCIANNELLENEKTQQCSEKLCPEGWTRFGTRLYYFSTEKKTWHEGQQDCKNRGADLIIINSQQEQGVILHMDVWIGLTDSDHEGTWKWVDGTPLTTSFWRDGEPNNAGEEDCAHNVAGKNPIKSWNDALCSYKSFWVCEKEA
ncbi:low affinity immunoglobulin epsilon Fc receptor-like [Brienomyrus brachyistius]|uniref:low affinity immunoglobulin epsilon Fc receptor-like n=1 Tax=Brienomyrus brachyistius TaxID=42636 RepID=UPI0020B37773|nr:low affinity immunoglobulin epsilon Fc receptor-like [Brienomyrus brachyistius]